MPVDAKLNRVLEPDDPRRCKAVAGYGQCPYEAMEDSQFCSMHGGNKAQERAEKERIRNYRLAKWRTQLDGFTDSPHLKSLREEVGILRMLMQETLDKCQDASDLFMMSNKIGDLVERITKTVAQCHRLEQSTGQMLDKTAALNFASQVVEIIGRYISDTNALDMITNDMLSALQSLSPVAVKGSEDGV
jgi:hypothetical protein